MTPPVVAVVGWKNSGKTTLVARLVRELSARGLRVSTVKHAHHQLDMDKPGSDTVRHRDAGAVEVAAITGKRVVIQHELRGDPEPTLHDVIARLLPADIIIAEGFKSVAAIAKIEVRGADADADAPPLSPADESVIAIVAPAPSPAPETGAPSDAAVPVFSRDDIAALADLVMARCHPGPKKS